MNVTALPALVVVLYVIVPLSVNNGVELCDGVVVSSGSFHWRMTGIPVKPYTARVAAFGKFTVWATSIPKGLKLWKPPA